MAQSSHNQSAQYSKYTSIIAFFSAIVTILLLLSHLMQGIRTPPFLYLGPVFWVVVGILLVVASELAIIGGFGFFLGGATSVLWGIIQIGNLWRMPIIAVFARNTLPIDPVSTVISLVSIHTGIVVPPMAWGVVYLLGGIVLIATGLFVLVNSS